MKKIILASLFLFAINITVHAQTATKPTATVQAAAPEKVKAFNEKVAQSVDAIVGKDVNDAQAKIAYVVGAMMDRANDLSIAKAPQSEVDSRRKQGQQLKFLSIDPVANKAELLKLMKEMQANY